jgi:hypothetical protein
VQNKQKIFAFLWNQCSESVQQRIKGMSGYPDRIKNDHVELLKAIYQQCLVSNQEHYYDMKVVNDAIMNMCYFKTNKDESASEFYRRSATIRDIIVKAIGVPIHMDGVIQAEKDSEKDKSAITDQKRKEIFEMYLAYIMVIKACKNKFGSLFERLDHAQQLKEMKYPKTLEEAKELLTSHTWDAGWNKESLRDPTLLPMMNDQRRSIRKVMERSRSQIFHLHN